MLRGPKLSWLYLVLDLFISFELFSKLPPSRELWGSRTNRYDFNASTPEKSFINDNTVIYPRTEHFGSKNSETKTLHELKFDLVYEVIRWMLEGAVIG